MEGTLFSDKPFFALELVQACSRQKSAGPKQFKGVQNGGLFIFVFFRGRFWSFFGVPGSMLSCFSGFLLLCFSASLLFCVSAFPTSLLFCFSAFCFPSSLLFLLLCFSASLFFLLLCFCTSVPFYFLFYFFFSSVMCFCCSTSCSFASLLPVFTVSLFFIFFCFILVCLYPKWNPTETLGETQRNPTWKPKWTLKKP